MPKFVTIGYGDQAGYDAASKEVVAAAHAHDDALKQRGALMGIAGSPVQVRNHEAAGVETQEGPYRRADLPVAGFAVIDAADLSEAIALVSKSPCAVAGGVVEVWPLDDVED